MKPRGFQSSEPSGKALDFDSSIPRFDNFVGNKIEQHRGGGAGPKGEAQDAPSNPGSQD